MTRYHWSENENRSCEQIKNTQSGKKKAWLSTCSAVIPGFLGCCRDSLLSSQPIFILHRHMGEAAHPSDEHMSHADTLNDSHEPSEASWRAKHGNGGGAQPLFTSSHEVLPALQLRSSAVAPLISASGSSGGAAEVKCHRAGNQNQRKIQRTGKKCQARC